MSSKNTETLQGIGKITFSIEGKVISCEVETKFGFVARGAASFDDETQIISGYAHSSALQSALDNLGEYFEFHNSLSTWLKHWEILDDPLVWKIS